MEEQSLWQEEEPTALPILPINKDDNWQEKLWQAVIDLEGEVFHTTGRGKSCAGSIPFSYEVSRETKQRGRHYNGENIPGYGNELWITTGGFRNEKSISRSTVELAYQTALALNGKVKGPRALGVPGARSYLYPLLIKLGVIKKN